MSLHDDGMDPTTPPRVHEWTREQIDAAQCGLCDLAHIQTTCAQGASRTALENLRFRLHVKWGTAEVPLKTPLLPLSVTPEDIADSFGCSPPDATPQRKCFKLWLVAINPRTGGFESVITRNAAAIVISPDEAPVRTWECDTQHAQQVNAEFSAYMVWRQKNAGRHHNTGQPWRALEEAPEGFESDEGGDRDGDDFGAFAPPSPPQRFPHAPMVQPFPQGFAPQAFPQAPAPQAFPQLPQGFAPQAFPQAPAPQTFPPGFGPQAPGALSTRPSAADAELTELRREVEAMKAARERDEREATAKRLRDAEEDAARLRRELEDARRTKPEPAARDLGTTVAAVVTAAAPLLEIFKASVESTRERERKQREDDERRRADEIAREERRRDEERDREEKRRQEEERRREEARREDEKREERRREEARREDEKREERRREERAEAHKERMATLKAGGGTEGAMSESLAAVRAELAELKGGKKDKGGVLGAIKEAREIMGLLGGKTDALDAAAKAAEVGDQNQTLEIIDAVGDKLEGPIKMLASEFMADREAKRKAAAARRGGYVQRGSGLLAAKRAKLPDGTEVEVPDDMVLLNDGTMIPLASWGSYLASMHAPQVPQYAAAPAFPQAPMFTFAPPPQVAAFAPPPQVAAFAPPHTEQFPPDELTQAAPPPQEAPPQVEVIEEAQEPPPVAAHDGPALDEVPEFAG